MIFESIWLATLTDSERRALEAGPDDDLPHTADVLIIGGGVVGLAIAYFLARRAAGKILLLEKGRLLSGASSANAGGIFPGQQGVHLPEGFRLLGMASLRLFTELAGEDWAEFDWRQNGSIAVAPERFACPMREHVAQEVARGRRAEHVSGRELAALEPALSPEITEAVYCPDDGRLNPVRTALSLAREARRLGATLRTGVAVERFETRAGRVARVSTSRGQVEPGQVVLATGWSAPRLVSELGVRLPIRPAKGQMVATQPLPWRLRTNIASTLALLQLRTGEIITGGTVEHVGEDLAPTPEAIEQIRCEAVRVVPALAEVPLVRAWAGLRPETPDGMPVIDRAPGLDNLLLAVGHFKNGVLLAPITGRLVAEWLVDGRPSLDLSPLRIGRFS